MKRCFSFSDQNSTVELVDERGCPEPTIMSEFRLIVTNQVMSLGMAITDDDDVSNS